MFYLGFDYLVAQSMATKKRYTESRLSGSFHFRLKPAKLKEAKQNYGSLLDYEAPSCLLGESRLRGYLSHFDEHPATPTNEVGPYIMSCVIFFTKTRSTSQPPIPQGPGLTRTQLLC